MTVLRNTGNIFIIIGRERPSQACHENLQSIKGKY